MIASIHFSGHESTVVIVQRIDIIYTENCSYRLLFQNKLLKKLFSEEDPKLVVPSNVRVKVSAQKPVLSTPKQNKKTVNLLMG